MTQPNVTDFLIETTVRLNVLETDGSRSCGTGFFYHKLLKNNYVSIFLVTNKHVLENAQNVNISMFTSKKDGNGYDVADYDNLQEINISGEQLAIFSDKHISDDVDIQIIFMNVILSPYANNGINNLYFKALDSNLIPNLKQLEKLFSFESIVFVGYPNGQWDEVNHLPIIRTGTSASVLSKDFNGKPHFLIDASVFPGSSGSPVFIANANSYVSRDGLVVGSRLLFLGVIAKVYQRVDAGDIIVVPAPTSVVHKAIINQMIDLGIVMKAHTVEETIDMFLEKNADKFE
ncbi:trypsin-like peptidase domain-containing protein [Bartonella sp. HY761]|uniref:trypsin-like peptidase domain-containing protein n=1 Tax=Bartonella sp. HY761 TaxID=2979330 RepID=UPI0021FB6C92|nr:trypsin-like peptidase domain-containing protein [Bartonella sp. HY761]UXN07522.1 serine protease [Bartonella sp. HY761]